jgi:hypothetical protein
VAHPTHGCVFPVGLVEELLSVCPAEPIILDPYIGSGTVAVAAKSVSESTVYGFDLNCATAREAVPEAVCYTRSLWDRHARVGSEVLVRDAARLANLRPHAQKRVRRTASVPI